jgi:hypothetical protein
MGRHLLVVRVVVVRRGQLGRHDLLLRLRRLRGVLVLSCCCCCWVVEVVVVVAAMFGRKGRRRGRPRVPEAVDPFVLFGLVGRVEAGGAVFTEPVPSGLRRHSSRNDQHSRGRRAAATRSSREEAFGGPDVVRGRCGSGSCWSCCSRLYRRDGCVCAFRYIQREERAGLVYSHTRGRAAWRERRLRRVQTQTFRMNRSVNRRTNNNTTSDDPAPPRKRMCLAVLVCISQSQRPPTKRTNKSGGSSFPCRNVPHDCSKAPVLCRR